MTRYSSLFAARWWQPLGLAGLLALGLATASCKKEEFDDYYTLQDNAGFGLVTTLGGALATKYAPTETVPVVVAFNPGDNLKDITVFQVINRLDSAVVGTYPANGQYNSTPQILTQVVPYTVPANLANKTPVRVDVTLTFADGSKRLRRFTYTAANSPTLKFGTTPVTYRNGLSATQQSSGDILGYSILLNEGGISTVPAGGSTATLFKNVDSLTTFVQVGTDAPRRLAVVRGPSAGAATTVTVNAPVPAGSNGKTLTYSFVAYAQNTSTSLTAAPINIVGPTSFATALKTGRVVFGSGAPSDSLAFNLKTALNEPAAGPAANKDLFVSGISTTSFTLAAANTTRYYKLTPVQVASGLYTTATANAIGLLLFQNTTSADLGTVAVNDVYAVRVRGTGEMMLLRITGIKSSAAGSTGRVKFEYRTL
ncbi:hypothetical protein [Hymenobacter metallilatus]|uniref:DUF4397 domain-containing protein n=1 Tax=Hymenobacter metallilatus TaxID=2493666 RepID=A0A428JRQ7_9BACT|nr:hypothetical protein [Hymenobacter metallilatus]RSK36236.1 hypothetical protein EI290_04955 [Hymenobacter metallilatus]